MDAIDRYLQAEDSARTSRKESLLTVAVALIVITPVGFYFYPMITADTGPAGSALVMQIIAIGWLPAGLSGGLLVMGIGGPLIRRRRTKAAWDELTAAERGQVLQRRMSKLEQQRRRSLDDLGSGDC